MTLGRGRRGSEEGEEGVWGLWLGLLTGRENRPHL